MNIRLGNGAVATPDVDVMTLQGNGNVGIGTTAPAVKLHVVGNTQLLPSGVVAGNDLQIISSGISSASPRLFTSANGLELQSNGQDGVLIVSGYSAATPAPATQPLARFVYAAGGEAMRILNNGNVGIGTTAPNTNAILDITSTTKGMLPPRVALTATNNPSPLSAMVAGMVVYNTASTTGGTNIVSPGLYFSDGSLWKQIQASASSVVYSAVASSTAQLVADISASNDPFTSHAIVVTGTVNAFCATGSAIFTLYIQQGVFQGYTLNGSASGGTMNAGKTSLTFSDACNAQTTTLAISSSKLTVASSGNGYSGQLANMTVVTY